MPGKGIVADVPQMEGGTYVLEDQAERIDITTIDKWDDIQRLYWHLKDSQETTTMTGSLSIPSRR